MSHIKKTLVFILLCFLADEALAGRWNVRVFRGLDLNTEYSGNVFLDGADTQQDMMLAARARISMTRRGSRASANINYAPELRYFVNGTQDNRIVHFLNATGDAELIKDLFGVRARATAGQTIIDPNAAFTQDGFTNPDNITDTYSLSITPYLLPIRLGDFAILSLGVNYNVVKNADSEVEDSLGRDAYIRLVSGRYFSRFIWSLSSRQTLTSYEDAPDDEIFGNLTATASYRINRSWQLNSTFGYDKNQVQTTRDINGGFWRLGATYQPLQRASFTAGVGERYNSTDYELRVRYYNKRLIWTADYSRNLQSARDEFLERSIFPENDEFGNPITDPTGDEASYLLQPGAALDGTVFIADRFNLGLDWSRRRTSASLNINYVRRDDLQIASVTRDWGVYFNLGRRLSPRSSARLNGSWLHHIDDTQGENNYEQWAAGINYSYRLTRRMDLSLGYRFTIREAVNGEDFGEDRLGISLNSSYEDY